MSAHHVITVFVDGCEHRVSFEVDGEHLTVFTDAGAKKAALRKHDPSELARILAVQLIGDLVPKDKPTA